MIELWVGFGLFDHVFDGGLNGVADLGEVLLVFVDYGHGGGGFEEAGGGWV
jgi:hypothetical protein